MLLKSTIGLSITLWFEKSSRFPFQMVRYFRKKYTSTRMRRNCIPFSIQFETNTVIRNCDPLCPGLVELAHLLCIKSVFGVLVLLSKQRETLSVPRMVGAACLFNGCSGSGSSTVNRIRLGICGSWDKLAPNFPGNQARGTKRAM